MWNVHVARSKAGIVPACRTGHLRVSAWRGGMRLARRTSGLTIGWSDMVFSVVEAALADVHHRLSLAQHPAAGHASDEQLMVAGRGARDQPALHVGQRLAEHGRAAA